VPSVTKWSWHLIGVCGSGRWPTTEFVNGIVVGVGVKTNVKAKYCTFKTSVSFLLQKESNSAFPLVGSVKWSLSIVGGSAGNSPHSGISICAVKRLTMVVAVTMADLAAGTIQNTYQYALH
jgi:hypothetical protein